MLVLTRLQPSATRFSFPNHELTSRKSQAVEIADEDALAPEWLAIITTSKPDKAAIKEVLKASLAMEVGLPNDDQIPSSRLGNRSRGCGSTKPVSESMLHVDEQLAGALSGCLAPEMTDSREFN